MTPYANLLYFGLLVYVAVPTAAQSLIGQLRLKKTWIVLATVFMLAVQYWIPQTLWPNTEVISLGLVLAYALVQWSIAFAFLWFWQRSKSRPAFYAALGLGLLPLVVTKFSPLLAPDFTLGFVGLSYVTFRTLDVIVSIHDGLIVELPPFQYLAYLLFFPTISSGPIDRYRRFSADWNHDRTRAEFLEDLDRAVQHVFRGLIYKFILALLIMRYWLRPIAHETGFLSIALYMYGYSFYLFFDFAGYSAFAVGLSCLLGIHTPENFNLPFLAGNIRDFWDRWHISLSTWFRDHIYMRFVIAATKGKWFKNRYTTSYLGFLLTFGLMGLWHGTAWHYIIYGFYHAALLIGHDLFSRWNRQHQLLRGRLWQVASIIITFNAVCFSLLIFSGRLG